MSSMPSVRRSPVTGAAPRGVRVSVWWLHATVTAIVLHVLVTQVFPGVLAAAPWIDAAWPERVQHVAFLLGLIVLGVIAQAAWWGLRRTRRSR